MKQVYSQDVVDSFIKKGFLLSPDVFVEKDFNTTYLNLVNTKILSKEKPVVIGSDLLKGISKRGISGVNWIEFEKSKVLCERGKTNKVYNSFMELMFHEKSNEEQTVPVPVSGTMKLEEQNKNSPEQIQIEETSLENEHSLRVVKSYGHESKPRELKDFVYHYKSRYEFLRKILMARQELQSTVSIKRAFSKENGETVSLIGLIYNKRKTKNGNILVNLEDPTGNINVIFGTSLEGVEFLCVDELIGVVGKKHDNFLYVSQLIYPDIPEKTEIKKSKQDICGVFISDVHIGSNMFMENKFLQFIDWLNGKHEDKKMVALSKKVKYLFVVGDVVDGVGIYPNQDKELTIPNIKGQYDRCAEFLSMIRDDIQIVLCPGNHDARRIAEPQPPLERYAGSLKSLKNLVLVSNPSWINVLAEGDFEGFDILLYHGYSYDYYAANIEPIAQNGGYDRGDLIMKFLLQKRHMAPAHASTLFVPSDKGDHLIIDKVPDIFASGHIHKSSVSKYRGVTTIVSSCWQYKTDFQERVGHHPEYCKVPVFDFKTGETTILDFE